MLPTFGQPDAGVSDSGDLVGIWRVLFANTNLDRLLHCATGHGTSREP